MPQQEVEKSTKSVTFLYWFTLFAMALSGFGQMPIYRRYYLSDIPGMAWAADFYTTHYLHYLAGVLFIALVAYAATGYVADLRKRMRLTASGWFRTAAAAALVGSGALLVYRNLPGYRFPQGVNIFLDLFHLTAAMALMSAGLYCAVKKKKWTAPLS